MLPNCSNATALQNAIEYAQNVDSSVTRHSGTQAVSNGGQFHETNIEATWNLLGYEGLNTIILNGHSLALFLHLTTALYELII